MVVGEIMVEVVKLMTSGVGDGGVNCGTDVISSRAHS